MSDINRLKQSVIDQAHQEGQKRLEQAKSDIEKDFSQRKAQLLSEKEADKQRQLKDVRQVFQIEEQQIRNKERQSTLSAKQELLTELFSAALSKMTTWSKNDELAFIKSILGKYAGSSQTVSFGEPTFVRLQGEGLADLKAAFPEMTFEEHVISKQAGLVVSDGKVDETYIYTELIEAIYKDESSRIAASIFQEK